MMARTFLPQQKATRNRAKWMIIPQEKIWWENRGKAFRKTQYICHIVGYPNYISWFIEKVSWRGPTWQGICWPAEALLLIRWNSNILNPLTIGNTPSSRGFLIFRHETKRLKCCHLNTFSKHIFENLKGNPWEKTSILPSKKPFPWVLFPWVALKPLGHNGYRV